jgi:hypothetical protein
MNISTTAQQDGFGTDMFKRVIGLTDEEKNLIISGETIAYDCGRKSYIRPGLATTFRIATLKNNIRTNLFLECLLKTNWRK